MWPPPCTGLLPCADNGDVSETHRLYLSALRDYRAIHLSSLNANAQVWLALHQLSFATATDILP